jgi:hypothetical protein
VGKRTWKAQARKNVRCAKRLHSFSSIDEDDAKALTTPSSVRKQYHPRSGRELLEQYPELPWYPWVFAGLANQDDGGGGPLVPA